MAGLKLGKKIDLLKLKQEVKKLSEELSILKGCVRDPEVRKANNSIELYLRLAQKKLRVTKLVVLRSLMRGRFHFSKNTNFWAVDYKLARMGQVPTQENIEDWISDIKVEFEIS